MVLVLAVVMLLPLLQTHNACAVDLTGKEKTLNFLSNVAMLDLSKYNVTLRSDDVTYPEAYGGVPEERVRYILQTNDSYLDATCFFVNAIFSHCLLSWRSGAPIYVQPQPSNLVDIAKVVLERYQAYVGSLRYQPLRAMLDSVSKAENTIVTLDNWKLDVIVNDRNTDFNWIYSSNGAERILLSINLQDGAIRTIGDSMGLFTVSDTELTVSSEEAISIAVNRAQNFSWRTGNGTQVNLIDPISEESATTQLFLTSRPPRDPFKLYSFWRVDLWLGKTYAGGVDHIAVGIWADTGEVSYIQELGGGLGGVSSDVPAGSSSSPSQSSGASSSSSMPDSASSPDSAAPPSQQPSDTSTPADSSTTENSSPTNQVPAAAFAAVAAAGVIATATALYLKKKRAD